MLMQIKMLLESRGMLKQQAMAGVQNHARLCVWKRLILIASMLLPGGMLAAFIPSQAAYAEAGWPQNVFICRAGDGGNGGVADHGSNGAAGAPGGDCSNGPKGGTAGPGGDHGSPGGPGGNVV